MSGTESERERYITRDGITFRIQMINNMRLFYPLSPTEAAMLAENRRMEGSSPSLSELFAHAGGSAVLVLTGAFNAIARPNNHLTYACDDTTLREQLRATRHITPLISA